MAFDKKAWQHTYYRANKEKIARYYQENRAGFLDRAKRNAERRSASVLIQRRVWAGEVNPGCVPPWLTNEHREGMQWFYDEARRLTKETGVSHVVDHIAPLNGATSCGLHVPWNLQVLTDAANKRKRFREDANF
jgi:5-methylcytosine-specific restriction endonuclease McrA